eukprot:2974137-Pyramimonas_sp.AAC.1
MPGTWPEDRQRTGMGDSLPIDAAREPLPIEVEDSPKTLAEPSQPPQPVEETPATQPLGDNDDEAQAGRVRPPSPTRCGPNEAPMRTQ